MKLLMLVFLVFSGAALAQSQELPSDWGSVLALIVTGLPALIAVFRGGINWPALVRSSTFWTALSGLVGAVGMFITGAIGLPALVAAIWFALAAVFLRNAVANQAKPAGGGGSAGFIDSASLSDRDRFR